MITISNSQIKRVSYLPGNRRNRNAPGQRTLLSPAGLYVEQGGNFLDTAHVYGDWVKDIERSICRKRPLAHG